MSSGSQSTTIEAQVFVLFIVCRRPAIIKFNYCHVTYALHHAATAASYSQGWVLCKLQTLESIHILRAFKSCRIFELTKCLNNKVFEQI